MAGGSLTITVPNYQMLQQVAQQVTCWAGGVAGDRRVQIVTATPVQAIRIPEEVFAGKGALVLEPGGPDLVSGYVAGTHITFNANNGAAAAKNPVTCAANPALPSISTIAMNVGGNPLQITLNYLNTANGTVDIFWGDGTSTLGAAESGASNKTYAAPGVYTIRVADNSAPATFNETTVFVPGF